MKLLNNIKSIIAPIGVFLILFLLNSCTDGFQNLNSDPSVASKEVIDPGLLLTKVQQDPVFELYDNEIIMEWAYYYNNGANGNGFTNRTWSFGDYYTDYLQNIAEVVRLTQDKSNLVNNNAIARIWRVWLYHRLTDTYGDIAYSEATLSVEEAISQPKYDMQQNIYKDLLNELKSASAALSNDESQKSYGSADLIYGGDVDKWRRFANSLRLRLAMRVRYADENMASTHISDVIDAPLIEDYAQSAILTTAGESAEDRDNWNPLYDEYYPEYIDQPDFDGHRSCTYTITDLLKEMDDPRLSVYCKPALDDSSGYKGIPYQLWSTESDTAHNEKSGFSDSEVARLGDLFWAAEYDIKVMTASEVSFLKAEAYLSGLANGNAESAYQKGIRLAMNMYEIDGSDITKYLQGPVGNLLGSQEDMLQQIIRQKYLALYYQPREAWAEYRRTGYPLMYKASYIGDTGSKNNNGYIHGFIPRRKTYPQREYSLNRSNVDEAASRLKKGDVLMSRIWWDVKSGVPYEHPDQGGFPPPQ